MCFCVLSTVKKLTNRKAQVRNTYGFLPRRSHTKAHIKELACTLFSTCVLWFRFAVSPQVTCTKNVRYACVLLACRRIKIVGKSDLQTIMGQVRVPYFPLASQCMIPKHVCVEWVKCTTAVLEAHLARMTRKLHAWSNIQFPYGWWAARKLVEWATCSTSTTYFKTLW